MRIDKRSSALRAQRFPRSETQRVNRRASARKKRGLILNMSTNPFLSSKTQFFSILKTFRTLLIRSKAELLLMFNLMRLMETTQLRTLTFVSSPGRERRFGEFGSS
jgi:hypothetical protein